MHLLLEKLMNIIETFILSHQEAWKKYKDIDPELLEIIRDLDEHNGREEAASTGLQDPEDR